MPTPRRVVPDPVKVSGPESTPMAAPGFRPVVTVEAPVLTQAPAQPPALKPAGASADPAVQHLLTVLDAQVKADEEDAAQAVRDQLRALGFNA